MSNAKTNRRSVAKASRVQLRLRPGDKALLIRAAQVRRTTLSNFVLKQALQAAEQILADQVHFTVSPKRWEKLCKALDAPARRVPALGKVLREKSVFDAAGRSAAR